MQQSPESQSPAEKHSTPVDGVDVIGALSPSRAGDFMTCPLLYRYRTIDKFPEEPSADAIRGTLVHKVLEDLYDLPALERTPPRAQEMLTPAWSDLVEAEPTVLSCSRRRRVRRHVTSSRGWPPAARCSTSTSSSRTRPGSSLPSASCTSRPFSTRSCCSEASSTASTSPPTGPSAYRTTRPAELPARCSRPRRCSR